MNFLWKRNQILLPGADHERKMHVARLPGQRFFKRKLKMADEAEGHSTILLAHTKIFTRLILILTKAHDFEAMGSVIDA